MKHDVRPRQHSIFAIPILLAILSLGGLVAGLLGTGFVDLLSWLGLTAPIAAIIWSLRRKPR